MRLALAGATLLLLAGCSSTPASTPASTPPTQAPPTTQAAGPAAFLAWAKAAPYGDKALSTATDDQLLGIGDTMCGMAGTATSFALTVQTLAKGNGSPSIEEATDMVRSSVTNLCPQYKALLP